MKCQRCLRNEKAIYRVYSDAIDLKVCAGCADEAQKIGMPVETLDEADQRPISLSSGDTSRI